jgi:hypothetical protein
MLQVNPYAKPKK